MSDQTAPEESGTKPVPQHDWLQRLVGEWKVESEMWEGPDAESVRASGTETVESLGGLWAFGRGRGEMPNGETMTYYSLIGYDVTFNEYRGCWFADVSSHLWKYEGTMSEDEKTLTLECDGPNMDPNLDPEKGPLTAKYRDVIELQDADHRTLSGYHQRPDGTWNRHMFSRYTRR